MEPGDSLLSSWVLQEVAPPHPTQLFFLGEAFPRVLGAEGPGHPTGCSPIRGSALLAHSLLTPQQIASLRSLLGREGGRGGDGLIYS